jgi:hypothetical protein
MGGKTINGEILTPAIFDLVLNDFQCFPRFGVAHDHKHNQADQQHGGRAI